MEAKESCHNNCSRSNKKGTDDDNEEDGDEGLIMEARDLDDCGLSPEQRQQRQKLTAAHGLSLNLGRAGGVDGGDRRKQSRPIAEDKISTQLETSVLVTFELPDGSIGEERFKAGQTVEVLKSYVENEFSIPMSNQQLFLDDRAMLDPLSLMDYLNDKDEMYIRVEGEMEEDAKK